MAEISVTSGNYASSYSSAKIPTVKTCGEGYERDGYNLLNAYQKYKLQDYCKN